MIRWRFSWRPPHPRSQAGRQVLNQGHDRAGRAAGEISGFRRNQQVQAPHGFAVVCGQGEREEYNYPVGYAQRWWEDR
ncbi:hypothetical protein M5W75_12585 [Paenibacillus larvae]|uniref:hypothetical protein n=1 Tax=Paenibacillus larvae TaxID=1464 RepID=UPI0009AEB46F|nr:hypothetical protein [Paenibacillus larvae]AQZ47970.1 hypothetical protein B5S25_16625 [Paenibacillus larvae subsp. pulvifaciens]MCY9750666.1 hypothetical protein [Paenibacillus larvae]